MFARKTVFVIGAGCSCEYELPMGDGLKDDIVNDLRQIVAAARNPAESEDQIVRRALLSKAKFANTNWHDVAAQFASGVQHVASIDRYLNFKQADESFVFLGKILIVRSILAAERRSTLYNEGSGIDQKLIKTSKKLWHGKHWLGELFEQMNEGIDDVSKLDSIFQNISFVCFNYDRCIEHYFFNAIKEFGSIPDADAANIMSNIKMFHPYGKVGRLPWEPSSASSQKTEFGSDKDDGEQLADIASGIKTFTEQIEEGTRLSRARDFIAEAENIVFLGYSFLDQNMELINPGVTCKARSVQATTFGVSEPDSRLYESLVQKSLFGRLENRGDGTWLQHQPSQAGRFMNEWGNTLRR